MKRFELINKMCANEAIATLTKKDNEMLESGQYTKCERRILFALYDWFREEVDEYTEDQKRAFKWLIEGGYTDFKILGNSQIVARYLEPDSIGRYMFNTFSDRHRRLQCLRSLSIDKNKYIPIPDVQ